MKKILTLLLSLCVLAGCNDFLDTDNLTKKDSSNFPKDESDIQSALTGIYDELREMTSGEEGQGFFITSELLSDDRFGGGGPDDRRMQAVDKFLKADENMFSDIWAQDYRAIYRANFLLEHIDGTTATDAEKQQARGETQFLRGYFYFQLCQLFGTVPLVNSTEAQNMPRATKEELYGHIASDLVAAINDLPSTPYSASDNALLGRATKWAAEGILARVFLYYTGFYNVETLPMGDSQLTRDDVIKYVDDCVQNSGYKLLPDFKSLWPYSNQYTAAQYDYMKNNPAPWAGENGGNSEAMFMVKYSTQATWEEAPWRANMPCLYFTPREGPDIAANFPFGIGWGVGPVNPRTYNDWPSNDPRRDASIASVEKEMPNYTWGNDKQMNESGFWQKKYAAFDVIDDDGSSINFYMKLYPEANTDYELNNLQDLVLLRFADVLLMQAELKRDAAPLNQVRARVGLSPVAYTDENLHNERHWELAFEGVRYWDLMRWHTAADVLYQNQNGANVRDNLVNTKMDFSNMRQRFEATGGLMPLPKTQVDLSAGVLEQNPGWGNESLMQ